MATYHWYRGMFEGLTSQTDRSIVLGTIAATETVRRIHMRFWVVTTFTSPATTVGAPIMNGIFLDPAGTGPTLDPTNQSNQQSHRWMHIESVAVTPSVVKSGSTTFFTEFGPVDGGGNVDVKSQRKAGAGAGSAVWWRIKMDPAVTGPSMYTWGSYSLLTSS